MQGRRKTEKKKTEEIKTKVGWTGMGKGRKEIWKKERSMKKERKEKMYEKEWKRRIAGKYQKARRNEITERQADGWTIGWKYRKLREQIRDRKKEGTIKLTE